MHRFNKCDFPHISAERDWEITPADLNALWNEYEVYKEPNEYHQNFVNGVVILTRDATRRQYAKQDENLDRLPLTKADRATYDHIVGKRHRLGSVVVSLAVKAGQLFETPLEIAADEEDIKKKSRVTLEVAGKAIYGLKSPKILDETVDLIEEQLAEHHPHALVYPYSPTPNVDSYRFQPYFARAFDRENPDYSFDKGRIEVKHPIANVEAEGWPPIDIYRRREVMLSLSRTDEATRNVLLELSKQGLEHEGNVESAHVSSVVARQAYERFLGQPDSAHRDLVLIRDQIMAVAFRQAS